jgi:hypothetical protein
MEETDRLISQANIKRLITQGYCNYSAKELHDYRLGFRLAYKLCAATVLLGLILNNIIILIIAATIALLGVIPPYHPFDYLYNHAVRYALHKPRIPPRPTQARFACGLAATCLSLTVYFLFNHQTTMEYIFGITVLLSAILVSTTDICIPSMIYKVLFGMEQKRTE